MKVPEPVAILEGTQNVQNWDHETCFWSLHSVWFWLEVSADSDYAMLGASQLSGLWVEGRLVSSWNAYKASWLSNSRTFQARQGCTNEACSETSVHFRMSDSHNANTCSADYTFYPLFRGSWDSPCLLSADKIEVGEFNVVTDTLFSA